MDYQCLSEMEELFATIGMLLRPHELGGFRCFELVTRRGAAALSPLTGASMGGPREFWVRVRKGGEAGKQDGWIRVEAMSNRLWKFYYVQTFATK